MSEPDADPTAAWSFETKQVHAGAAPDPTTGARATPIYQTTSYAFRDTEHAAAPVRARRAGQHLHADHEPDPGRAGAARRRARGRRRRRRVRLRAGRRRPSRSSTSPRPATTSSPAPRSTAAPTTCSTTRCRSWASRSAFVDDPDDLDAWRAAIRPNTKLLFAETLGNPRGNVLDVRAVADVAHEAGVPLIVDNTVPTPYLLRPIEHGADIVVHSATKFLGGHGTAIGGVVVDSGNFDWGEHADRFPGLTTPDPSYHGLELLGGARPAVLHRSSCGCSCCATSARRSRRRTLPAHPGHRDAVAAHRAARAERAGARRVAGGARRGGEGPLRGAAVQPVVRRWRRSTCRAAPARSSRSTCGAASRRASGSSTRWSCTATWPTSATCAAW